MELWFIKYTHVVFFRIKDERSYSASNAIFMVNLEQIIHTGVANNQLDGLFYITYR